MPSHIVLKAVRQLRTFSLTDSCRRHPFAWYGGLCTVLVGWANYAQYQRLMPMFPVYERYLKEEGGRMVQAKKQELSEVNRYNSMVTQMRSDLQTK
ncbi:hypothetical protein STCU_02621 [Strigomonas culicis]|nr:hypothetical protein STCU_02621 [Strigomonas culicis]|eukprot:EPY32830.1 hypothetical protein STCU_02621 [Strigomonas culicis]